MIPESLFIIIYEYTQSKDKHKFIYICKYFKKMYEKDLIYRIILIQKFYRKNQLNKNYLINPYHQNDEVEDSYMNLTYSNWNRYLLYRFYIREYPEQYLFNFPNFLTKKLYHNSYSPRALQLRDWLSNNENTMKKRYVNRFFRENNITSKEILIAGW